MAWLRYRVALLLSNPRPEWPRWSQVEGRYARTPAGGWRYFREVVCPAEVAWYEHSRGVR